MNWSLFLSLMLTLILLSCTAPTLVEQHGVLKTEGNKIVNKEGIAVGLSGMSLFWGNNGWQGEKYYNRKTIDYLVKDWGIEITRAAMGVEINGGFVEDPEGNYKKVEDVVNAAISNGIYVIVDYHSHHAEDYEKEAISFFDRLSQQYSDSPNIIYEIYNEPLNVSWDTILKPYSLRVIEAIRKNDPDNMIIVGTRNWSQEVDEVISNPITEYNNISYCLHFYAATHKEGLRAKAQKAIDNNIPLFISEWGAIEASGDGEIDKESVKEWMAFIESNKLSHCNWSVCDKDEGASIFKPNIGLPERFSDEHLSPNGLFMKNLIREQVE